MSRKDLKKNKSNILRLKLLIEDKKSAKDECDIGISELTEILNSFKHRISDDQKNKFQDFFFGPIKNNNHLNDCTDSLSTDIVSIDDKEKTNKDINNKKSNPSWIKKVYKQIVQRSHPDKYIDFPIEEIKNKYTSIYIDAVSAFEENDIGMLLLCAYEVEIDTSDIPESNSFIDTSIKDNSKKLQDIKSLIGYQWYHLIEENRIPFLESYITRLGFKFDQEKAKSIIKKNKIKRKVGTRPQNFRVKRNKLK